jgi:hypothetical protein
MELPDTLECCYELIRRLAEENAALRKSGDDFGRLAERINAALHQERRLAAGYTVDPVVAREHSTCLSGAETATLYVSGDGGSHRQRAQVACGRQHSQ